jgi:hypothetical protein
MTDRTYCSAKPNNAKSRGHALGRLKLQSEGEISFIRETRYVGHVVADAD